MSMHYGTAAVTVILTLESIGFPRPGESLLIFASVLAAAGQCYSTPNFFLDLPVCASSETLDEQT